MLSALTDLKNRLGEWSDVRSASAVLQWDEEVCMPPDGMTARGRQLATLAAIAHRQITDPDLESLARGLCDQSSGLSSDDMALVESALYDIERQKKLPESFVETMSVVRTQAYEAWARARDESEFAIFRPHLEKIVDLLRQKTDYLGYTQSPYDALLEDFERGMTTERLDSLFGDLAAKQTAFLDRVLSAKPLPESSWLDQHWPEAAQWTLCRSVLGQIGFPFDRGRLDRSVHPFSTSFDRTDVRITTRIDEKNPFSSLFGTIHEAGHALYELGFLEKDARTPLAQAPSLGMHESQSLFWENILGGSKAFWTLISPRVREAFPDQTRSVSDEDLYLAANQVRRSFIRVDADECTYNLHIVLRFEIERSLIEGSLSVSEIPEYWNARFRELIGLDVPRDSLGCLQDIHWSHGDMGYFPSYALGNLYAAQLAQTLEKDLPDFWDQVGNGQFADILDWLRKNVHHVGRRQLAPEILEQVTGQPPGSQPFLDYLDRKYTSLYGMAE